MNGFTLIATDKSGKIRGALTEKSVFCGQQAIIKKAREWRDTFPAALGVSVSVTYNRTGWTFYRSDLDD